jgi:Mg-chelatase subunit ChlD
MAMDGTFSRARTLVAKLLEETRRGDRIALIVVGGERAHIAVPFGRHVGPVVDLVMTLRPRGRTPLIDGIERAVSMCANRWAYTGCATPVVLVITDGRDNQRVGSTVDAARNLLPPMHTRVPGAILALRVAGQRASVRCVARQLGWEIRELGSGDDT